MPDSSFSVMPIDNQRTIASKAKLSGILIANRCKLMIRRIMKLFLPILYLFLTFNSFSQKIEASWSAAIENSLEEVPYKIFPNADSGFTLVKRSRKIKNSISLDIIDSNNTVIATSKNIQIQGDKILAIELVGGKITLFSVFHNDEKKQDELSAYSVNAKGELSGTTLITSLKSNGGYLSMYKIAVSEDGQKVGVVCEKAYIKEKNEELIIKILDKDLQPILTKDYSYAFPVTKRRFNVPFINNEGSLYIVKRTRVKASNKYFITLIKQNGTEEHRSLKLRNMRIADLGGAFTKDGELILAGFYAGYSSLSFEGAFNFKFKESTLPLYRKEFMLPGNLVTGLKTKKEISKFGTGLDKYHIKNVIVTDKGFSYLVAEHLSVIKTEKETVETRKGIAVIKFSSKGDFLWGAPVLIDQVDEEDKGYWSSAIVVGSDDRLLVLHNPVGEGLKKTEDIYGSNSVIGTKICKIGTEGNVVHKAFVGLFNDLPESVTLNARSYYFSQDKLIIVAENEEQSKYYLGNLTLVKED